MFWAWINPSKWKDKIGTRLLSWVPVILSAQALFFATVYYIQCNVVPVNDTLIGGSYGADVAKEHVDNELTIHFNYDYGTKKYLDGIVDGQYASEADPNPGLYFYWNLKESHDSLYQYSEGAQFHKKQQIDAILESKNLKGIIEPDSVRLYWQYNISYGMRYELGPFVPRKRLAGEIDSMIKGDIAILFELNPVDANDKYLCEEYNIFVLDAAEHSPETYDGFNRLHQSPWLFAPFDMSQYHEKISFRGLRLFRGLKLLKINYGTAVQISGLNPEPDVLTYDGFEYTDKDKIRFIILNGLEYHVSIPELANIQLAKIFALTTIVTLLLTLFLKLLWIKLKPVLKFPIFLNKWFLFTVIIVISIFIYITLFNPIAYG